LTGETTDGTLLGGRDSYRQGRDGYRTGREPVLLAASIPARPGERVLEAGTGAGAGLLALSARVPDLTGLGIEIDAAQAALARENLLANNRLGLRIERTDLEAWTPDAIYDHAFANPPWHDAAGTPSPYPGRRGAKQAQAGLLGRWTAALARSLRRRGTLSLILPASALGEGVAALQGEACPEITLHPIWRRAGQDARLIILCGVLHGRGGCRVLPGLVLHQADGALSQAAEDVLRGAQALHQPSSLTGPTA